MFSQNTSRRVATLVGVAAPAILVTNIAFAAWTATGDGPGTATAGTSSELVVTDAAPAELLYPDGTADLAVSVKNNNPFAVEVDTIEWGDVTSTGCVHGGSVAFEDASGVGTVIATGATVTITLTDAASMDADAPEACKEAVFTSTATVTGHSVVAP